MAQPQTKSCHQSDSFMIITVKKSNGVDLINLRILLLKIPKLSAFRIVGSSLFHSVFIDGKQALWNKLCLVFISGYYQHFLQHKKMFFSGIKLKRIRNLDFYSSKYENILNILLLQVTLKELSVRHKNRRKHNQNFELLLFIIILHFGSSN